MKILITPKSFSKEREKAFQLLNKYDVEVIENNTGKTYTEEQMIDICSDIDGVIVGIDPMGEKVLRAAKNLKAISKYGAGLDNIDLKVAEELGIQVKSAAGSNADSVAELAIGMLFAISRSIVPATYCVKHGGWDRTLGHEVGGKFIGIIGLGYIGRKVAKMACGLGMVVLAHDPYFNDQDFIQKYNIQMLDLKAVLTKSDFISLHLPLLRQTEHMINRETLSWMKESAYLINTSRGGLVDEEALYDALVQGKLAGAAQDVFSSEPPGDHKLLKLDNFILTPHIGAYTQEATERMVMQSTKNLLDMLFKE